MPTCQSFWVKRKTWERISSGCRRSIGAPQGQIEDRRCDVDKDWINHCKLVWKDEKHAIVSCEYEPSDMNHWDWHILRTLGFNYGPEPNCEIGEKFLKCVDDGKSIDSPNHGFFFGIFPKN